MKKRSFDRIREIVYDTSGISLSIRKEALVSARVGKRMRALGITGYEEYLQYLEDNHAEEVVGLLDAVSTNVTSFFREPHHFEFIADEAARWYEQGQRRFRFWSAACSTGEEPYTLAMVLLTAFPAGWDLEIIASDLSTKVLDRASAGLWPLEKSKEIPGAYLKAFMLRGFGAQEGLMKAGPEIRALISDLEGRSFDPVPELAGTRA